MKTHRVFLHLSDHLGWISKTAAKKPIEWGQCAYVSLQESERHSVKGLRSCRLSQRKGWQSRNVDIAVKSTVVVGQMRKRRQWVSEWVKSEGHYTLHASQMNIVKVWIFIDDENYIKHWCIDEEVVDSSYSCVTNNSECSFGCVIGTLWVAFTPLEEKESLTLLIWKGVCKFGLRLIVDSI